MEVKIGSVAVKKIITGSVAIFCNQQVVFVNTLPTINIRQNVLYAYNGSLQSWTGLAWIAYTGGTAGSHNDLSGRDAPNAHPASAISGLAAVATSGSYNDLSDTPEPGLDKTFQVLTEAATIIFNAAISVNSSVTLTASRMLGNITNAVKGEIHCVKVTQGGTGSYALTYGNQYKFSGGIRPVLSATGGAVDLLYFLAVSTTEFHFTNANFDVKTP